MVKRILTLSLILLVVLAGGLLSASAQDEMGPPQVNVVDQLSLDGSVWIQSAYSEGYGFIVIHIDNGSGAPGPVIGQRWINPGWSYNVHVAIDTRAATPILFAMLHKDDSTPGVYEFGTVEGADAPVAVDGKVVTPSFNVNILNANDQFVADGRVTISSVTMPAPGFVVVHKGDATAFGAVAGATAVPAGTSTDVVVEVTDPTEILWPMLHVDTGEVGKYEFGQVEGVDGPVVVDNQVATAPIWTVPHARVADQIVVHGDNLPAEMMAMMPAAAPTIVAKSVLSEGPGFLVIHSDNGGRPGPVLGFAAVNDGTNLNVTVELSTDGLTPIVWPMLHVDTGTVGTYEFGTVEGADGPVQVNNQVVTFPINAAPSYKNCEYHDGHVRCEVLIDAPGFLAIHADDNGNPGAGLAVTPLIPGWNLAEVALPADAGATVFPMLHYDTGTVGVYEFGTVEGADGPTFVGGNGVFGPLAMQSE